FWAVTTAYSNELSAFLHRCQGLSSLAKRDFFTLFWKAWGSSFRQPLILKAFESTGILPLDPDVILRRFTNISPADQSSQESSVSVLSASDWREIERLLWVVANGSRTKHTKKLSQTIHSISVKQQLFQHENEGLREALSNKKRRQ
ncbi:hypothetical protein EJ02DRAFT_324906, partial [Clathrospora elynae]